MSMYSRRDSFARAGRPGNGEGRLDRGGCVAVEASGLILPGHAGAA